MRKNLLCMTQEVGKHIIHMTSLLNYITEDNVKIYGEIFRLETESSETDERLVEEVI